MSDKHPLLLPAGSVPTPSHGAGASSRTMSRRNLTQNACVGCRRKRTKCDGRIPCAGCLVRKERCEYEDKTYVTKDDLRAEVKKMRLETINNRAVLRALLGQQHGAIAQRLRAGETIDAVAHTLTDLDITNLANNNKATDDTGLDQTLLSPISSDSRESVSPSTASTIPGYDFSLPLSPPGAGIQLPITSPGSIFLRKLQDLSPGNIGFVNPFSPASGVLHPVELAGSTSSESPGGRRHGSDRSSRSRDLSTSSYASWSSVAANGVAINSLLSLFFSWEIPPFTMVCQELFMRDYFQSDTAFCSSALVNAIASLATRYLEETKEVGEAYLLGERFFRESRRLLVLDARKPTLPTIQAFGLLGLRELSSGRECEAQTLCLQAVHCLALLEEKEPEPQNRTPEYLTVYSTTISGVLSLARIIGLITPRLSPTSVASPGGPFDRMLPVHLEEQVAQIRDNLPKKADPSTSDLLTNFIFDLTDDVYVFLSRAGEFGTRRVNNQLQMVYQKCLGYYQSVTSLLQGDEGKSSPYTLFVHLYFQFSLVLLFYPFVHQYIDIAGDWPRTICSQATKAVLDLTQSYERLYSLRQTPCLAPYCVFAAGLTQIMLDMEERGVEGASPQPASRSTRSATTPSSVSVAGSSPAQSSLHADSPSQSDVARDGTQSQDTAMSGTTAADPAWTVSSDTNTETNTSYNTPGSEQADPGLTHAVYLLSQMSLGHPASAHTAWVLRNFDPDSSFRSIGTGSAPK